MPDLPSPIRVLCADDHPLLREGLAALIGKTRDIVVAGEASSGREAILQFRALRPDVTLMDLQMPEMGGIEALQAIRAEFPDARVIVLTTYAADALAHRAMKAGAQAYVLKEVARKDLLSTIRTVHAGEHLLAQQASAATGETPGAELTLRERAVLALIAAGKSNSAIASELDISEETVKSHLKNIRQKLHARDRAHAVALGHDLGFID